MPIKPSPKLIEKILEQYQLSEKINQIPDFESGYRNTVVPLELNSGEKLGLIFYKSEPGIVKKIKAANQVSDYLAKKDWPTRHSIKKNSQAIIKISLNQKKYYCCLYNYLPGITINWEDYSMKHIKLLGQVLGSLHHQLSNFDIKTQNLYDSETRMLERKTKEMINYFNQKNVLKAVEQKLKLSIEKKAFVQFEQLLTKLKKHPSNQILHLDFVRSNILFNFMPSSYFQTNPNQKKFALDVHQTKNQNFLTITGILDFEKVSLGPPIIDLARTLAFLLIDCKYKAAQKIRKYFLYSGYHKRGEYELPDAKLLNPLVDFFLFYDFYKFLQHNPYEFLSQNDHYLRTKKYLIQRNLVSLTIK